MHLGCPTPSCCPRVRGCPPAGRGCQAGVGDASAHAISPCPPSSRRSQLPHSMFRTVSWASARCAVCAGSSSSSSSKWPPSSHHLALNLRPLRRSFASSPPSAPSLAASLCPPPSRSRLCPWTCATRAPKVSSERVHGRKFVKSRASVQAAAIPWCIARFRHTPHASVSRILYRKRRCAHSDTTF